MSKYYTLFCTRLGEPYKIHNMIVKALNNEAAVLDWISPQHGHFLVQVDERITQVQLRDVARVKSAMDVFICPFDPRNFAYSLDKEHADKCGPWLDKHSVDAHKGQIKTLSEEFETYSVHMPDGAQIVIHDNGEVYVQEKDQPEQRVRYKSELTKHMIK